MCVKTCSKSWLWSFHSLIGHGKSHLSRVRRASRPAPGHDPGRAAQYRLSCWCETNVGGPPERRGTDCWTKPGCRSKTTWTNAALTDRSCWVGQFRCWWSRLARQRSRAIQEMWWPVSARSIRWPVLSVTVTAVTASTDAPIKSLIFATQNGGISVLLNRRRWMTVGLASGLLIDYVSIGCQVKSQQLIEINSYRFIDGDCTHRKKQSLHPLSGI